VIWLPVSRMVALQGGGMATSVVARVLDEARRRGTVAYRPGLMHTKRAPSGAQMTRWQEVLNCLALGPCDLRSRGTVGSGRALTGGTPGSSPRESKQRESPVREVYLATPAGLAEQQLPGPCWDEGQDICGAVSPNASLAIRSEFWIW